MLLRTETVCCEDGDDACEWGRSSLRVCADRKTCVQYDEACSEDPPPPSDAGRECQVIEYKVCASGALQVRTGCCEADPLCGNGRPSHLLSCPDGSCAYGSCPDPVYEEDAGSCQSDPDAGD